MKHVAQIQKEFVKESAAWDDLSYDSQKEYLQAHPASQKRVTKQPGEGGQDVAVLEESINQKRGILDDKDALAKKKFQMQTTTALNSFETMLPDRLTDDEATQSTCQDVAANIEFVFNGFDGEPTLDQIKEQIDPQKMDAAREAVSNVVADTTVEAAEQAVGKKSSDLKLATRAFIKKAIPAAIFGFIDNAVMVIAGEYIDKTIATSLGVGTMAAAGLGNTTSDMVGAMGQDSIDKLLDKMGIEDDNDPNREKSKLEKWAGTSGSIIGIGVGCLVGMIPLAFMKGAKRKNMKHSAQINKEFVKEARKWDDLTLQEQKAYLKRHPRSKRKLTAKPQKKKKTDVSKTRKKLEKKRKEKKTTKRQKPIESLQVFDQQEAIAELKSIGVTAKPVHDDEVAIMKVKDKDAFKQWAIDENDYELDAYPGLAKFFGIELEDEDDSPKSLTDFKFGKSAEAEIAKMVESAKDSDAEIDDDAIDSFADSVFDAVDIGEGEEDDFSNLQSDLREHIRKQLGRQLAGVKAADVIGSQMADGWHDDIIEQVKTELLGAYPAEKDNIEKIIDDAGDVANLRADMEEDEDLEDEYDDGWNNVVNALKDLGSNKSQSSNSDQEKIDELGSLALEKVEKWLPTDDAERMTEISELPEDEKRQYIDEEIDNFFEQYADPDDMDFVSDNRDAIIDAAIKNIF